MKLFLPFYSQQTLLIPKSIDECRPNALQEEAEVKSKSRAPRKLQPGLSLAAEIAPLCLQKERNLSIFFLLAATCLRMIFDPHLGKEKKNCFFSSSNTPESFHCAGIAQEHSIQSRTATQNQPACALPERKVVIQLRHQQKVKRLSTLNVGANPSFVGFFLSVKQQQGSLFLK